MTSRAFMYYCVNWWNDVRGPMEWDMEYARDLQSIDPDDTTDLIAPLGWVT